MSVISGLKLNEKNGFFYLDIDGEIIAKMTFYFTNENVIVIDHAEVDEEHNGKGYGRRMVKEAVEFAREKDIKIIPVCPFVRRIFELVPDFGDVLK